LVSRCCCRWNRRRCGAGIRNGLLRTQRFMYRRERLPRRGSRHFLFVARRSSRLWRRQQARERARWCDSRRRLVAAVRMRRGRKRMHWTRVDRCRVVALVVAVFPLKSVDVEVVDGRQANAEVRKSAQSVQKKEKETPTTPTRRIRQKTNLCLLATSSASMPAGRGKRRLA
jgi:hypothetical protein